MKDLFPGSMIRTAVISDCRKYRYSLSRKWDKKLPCVTFCGLNPSTADDTSDDPTMIRCINFAKSWGYGSLYMINLFAIRCTDSGLLKSKPNIIGKYNDFTIKSRSKLSEVVIACWGTKGSLYGRDKEVIDLIGDKLYFLELSKDGFPKHPLYLKKTLRPKKWQFSY